MSGEIAMSLPRYRCHKDVWALKIDRVETDGNGALLHPENAEYAAFRVSVHFVDKHKPQAGGYWVQYKDGYTSYSPAQAFEEGYTLITPIQQQWPDTFTKEPT